MKFLVIVTGITALGLCKDAVKAEDRSTIDQIRLKARQIHKQFDSNKDGHVSLEEIGEGIKKGVGLFADDEEPSYTRQFYEKYIAGKKDKSKYLIEEDFEEIFSSRDKANQESLLAQAQSKAKEIYDSLDSDKSGDISLEELKNKIKSGLKIGIEEAEDTEKSLSDKISQLYDKYVKSDKKNSKGFTQEDISDIVLSRLKDGKKKVQKSASDAKKAAGDAKKAASDAVEDAADSVSDKAKDAKKKVTKKASDIKDSASDAVDAAADKASELKDAAAKKAKDIKDSASDAVDAAAKKAKDIKDSASDAVDAAADKASELKDAAAKKAKDLKDSASETIDNIADKASDLKDSAAKKAQDIKDSASDVIDAAADKASELKDSAIKKAKDLKDSAAETIGDLADKASEKAQDLKDSASNLAGKVADKVADKAGDLKDAAAETISDAAGKVKKSAGEALQSAKESGEESLEALKEKANEIYSKFDKNGDDSISFQELKQAIKSGLGMEQSKEKEEDDKSYTERLTGLYNKYVKGEKKDSVNKEAFFNIFSDEKKTRQLRCKKNCKDASKLSLEQLKAKALDIHDQFDKNDDGRVSLEEAAEGIKSKLGFGEEEESDSKSLFQYVKDLYQKYIGSGKKKDLALSGDDFTDIIYEWKAQCSAKHDKEEL